MHFLHSDFRIYCALALLTLVTAGGSIAYLSHVAASSETKIAREYPAPSTSVAFDNATLVKNITEGHGFSLSTTSPYLPDTWRTPGYPAFVLPFYILFHSFYPVLLAQIVTLFLTVLLIFTMTHRLLGRRWAFGLSVLYLLLPDTMLSASALLNENVFVLLFMSALYLFFFARIQNIYLRFALTGVLLALATYVRPASIYILIFFIPAYFLLYLRRDEITRTHLYAALLLIAAFMATLAPWELRNQARTGSFSFASTGPYVLFRQNATQFYASLHGIGDLEARYALEDRAGLPHGPVPQGPVYSPVLKKVALEVIAEHPVRYAIWHLTTFIPFFTSSGANDYWVFVNNMGPNFDRPPEPSLIQALHPFSLSTLLTVLKNHGFTLVENVAWALITLLVLASLWRGKEVRLMRFFFALIIYFALVTGPIAHARYRIPVEPLILLGAFVALQRLNDKHNVWQKCLMWNTKIS